MRDIHSNYLFFETCASWSSNQGDFNSEQLSERVINIIQEPEEIGPASKTSYNASSRRTGEVDAIVMFEPKTDG